MKNLLITGGAGFIGANFVHHMVARYGDRYNLIVFDKLTYAGNLDNLAPVADRPNVTFVQGDIADAIAVEGALRDHAIDGLVSFAAESHVDRSIMEPDAFMQTNVMGVYVLLDAIRRHPVERALFVSTDEVYGHNEGRPSVEGDALVPRSPYAASKASGDLLVYSYFITYGLPVLITRGANNVGPYQYPEKAVPLFTTNLLQGKPIPVYGDGRQMRDYQYVLDHCEAIDLVLHEGQLGEAYNIATGEEMENLEMIRILLDELGLDDSLVQFVEDRAGHDRRYSLDISKIRALGWEPRHSCEEAIRETVRWYRENEAWWRAVRERPDYAEYYARQYGGRRVIG